MMYFTQLGTFETLVTILHDISNVRFWHNAPLVQKWSFINYYLW